jgi:lactoylglutathione lyase
MSARAGVALVAFLAAPVHAQINESKLELFVTDVQASVHFYRVLGFEVAHEKEYGYTTLRAADTVVALSPLPSWLPLHWLGFLRHPPLGTEIVLYTGELEILHAAMADAGYDPGEITRQSWGDRDFRVTDRDGYYVRVSEGAAVPVPGR